MLPQPAHQLQLLGVDVMYHGAGGKEEQCLEEGMVHQMEQTSCERNAASDLQSFRGCQVRCLHADTEQIGAGAEGQEHVAELADGRIGENALDQRRVERHRGGH